jgi:DNA-binding MarR family transcriptional regulator
MSGKTQAAAHEILQVVPQVMRTLALEMRRTGHTPAPVHCRLLVLLAEGPHNVSELAEKQAVSLPTMSNSITTLVEHGWVTRVRPPHDRRMVQVELTPAGRAALSEIMRSVEARLRELLEPLSPGECDQLLAGLAVLRASFAHAALCTPGSQQAR